VCPLSVTLQNAVDGERGPCSQLVQAVSTVRSSHLWAPMARWRSGACLSRAQIARYRPSLRAVKQPKVGATRAASRTVACHPDSTAALGVGLDSRLAAFAKECGLRCRCGGRLRSGWSCTRDPDRMIPPGHRLPKPAVDRITSPRSSCIAGRRRLARRRICERLSGCALRSVPGRCRRY
jgi:hypothetical protein